VTRWPARPRSTLEYGDALMMALCCPQDAAGRPLRPIWLTDEQAAAFAKRWRAERERLAAEHPTMADAWGRLDRAFCL
jgi:hypothetical protein